MCRKREKWNPTEESQMEAGSRGRRRRRSAVAMSDD